MESGLLLDVVVGESAAILELLASEDEALLIGGDSCGNEKHKNTRMVSGERVGSVTSSLERANVSSSPFFLVLPP